ncbi:MAG: formylglycine-generating enzyme family protein, partial [Planctomycetaceae bacterium]|nr:formylglycine-generating enzyme family protein [Planctomycetaceae bacterium]
PGLTLNINGLASIDANVAKELAAWKGATLDLSGLEQLSQPAAEALAEWHGELLRLTSLKSIGNDVAQELVKADAESLDLVRLVSVSEETFAILKQNPRITLPANLLPATVNPEKAMKSSAALDISSATDVPPNKRLPLPADLPETITNSIGIKMKMIPAGNFNFRLTKNSKAREIKITDPYFIGITEVTNAQWKAVMGSVPSKWKDDERPVEQVKLEDILTYCEKLSALPKERAAGRVYRFPTEAEWEFACRAGSPTLWPTTIEPSMRGDFGWFGDNSEGQTHPVGQKRANAWGLYDMRGNVSEFCSKPISQAIRANTKAQELIQSGASQLALGGNWRSKSSLRGLTISRESPFVGFRLVLSPSGMK